MPLSVLAGSRQLLASATVGFGVAGDCITLQDASMTVGVPVLTSTSGPFVAADVNKLVTVADGFGPTVTLATITAYLSPTQVVLSTVAARTVSSAYMNYGHDDTAALQAWINALQNDNKRGILPSARYLISAPLVISSGCSIEGEYCDGVQGTWAVGAGSSVWYPVLAPNLVGTVVVQGNINVDAFLISACGRTVNLANIGVIFASFFNTTGHGFNATPPVYLSGFDNGIINTVWKNLKVYGHDGNHYGYYEVNAGGFTRENLISWGGGGIKHVNNGQTNYGNGRFSNISILTFVGGAAHCFHISNILAIYEFVAIDRISTAGLTLGQVATIAVPGIPTPTAAQYMCLVDNTSQFITFPGANDFESHLAAGSCPIQLGLLNCSYAQAAGAGLGSMGGNPPPQLAPVSGTVYQNSYGCPCVYHYTYTVIGGTDSSLLVQMAATSGFGSPATVGQWDFPAGSVAGTIFTGSFVLLVGWYFKFTAVNMTQTRMIAIRVL
jgi:hypothetical protein